MRRQTKMIVIPWSITIGFFYCLSLVGSSQAGSNPKLIEAAKNGETNRVKSLVESGADPNIRMTREPSDGARNVLNRLGSTPFLQAAKLGDVPYMKLLVEYGADPSLATVDGTTPLMAAAGLGTANPLEEAGTEAEALEAVQLLLELGADINALDSNGDTAMHGAAYGNFPTIVQPLADRGADISIWKRQDTAGRTPLFIAEGIFAAEIVERVPVRSCRRRGAAIDLVLDRARENRSQIVYTTGRGREMVKKGLLDRRRGRGQGKVIRPSFAGTSRKG